MYIVLTGLDFHWHCTVNDMCHRQIHNGLIGRIFVRHTAPSHQHRITEKCPQVLNTYVSNVCLRWDYFVLIFFILSAIYGIVRMKLIHSGLVDREDISVTPLTLIIKSEVSIVPIAVISFRDCVYLWKAGDLFPVSLLQRMMCVNNSLHFGPTVL